MKSFLPLESHNRGMKRYKRILLFDESFTYSVSFWLPFELEDIFNGLLSLCSTFTASKEMLKILKSVKVYRIPHRVAEEPVESGCQ